MAQSDLSWLRATFPGATVETRPRAFPFHIGFGLRWPDGTEKLIWQNEAKLTRDEHAIRKALGLENDKGAEGVTWRGEQHGASRVGVFSGPADGSLDTSAPVYALESFLRAVSAPRKAAELEPLDFVAGRDAEFFVPDVYEPQFTGYCVRAGDRVRAEFRDGLALLYVMNPTGPSRMLPASNAGTRNIVFRAEHWPRIHAELCALRDGAFTGTIAEVHKTPEALSPSERAKAMADIAARYGIPEPPPAAVVEPPKCSECGAVFKPWGCKECVYCWERIGHSKWNRPESGPGIGPKLDAEPGFNAGSCAWSSASWDEP